MKTILIVDDNPNFCSVLHDLCDSLGCATLEAHSAQEALSHLEKHPDVSLVLTDQVMRAMTGYELIRHMRTHDETRNIPIILFTSSSRIIQDLLASEGVNMMSKFVAPPRILSAIRSALGMPGGCASPRSLERRDELDYSCPTVPYRIIQTSMESFVPRERVMSIES